MFTGGFPSEEIKVFWSLMAVIFFLNSHLPSSYEDVRSQR